MNEQIEDFCFDRYSVNMQKLEIRGKKIFIFASHATAIRAWFHQSNGKKLNLITFDEHTDSFPPLLRYRNAHLGRTDKKLLEILDKIKKELSDKTLHDLLLPECYLRKKGKNWEDFELDINCKLWHDEHITTAMILDLIDEVYICCHSADDPSDNIDSEKICNLYNKIHYLKKAFSVETNFLKLKEDRPNASREWSYISQLRENNISNERLKTLFEAGLQICPPFILDVDLDYFRDIHVLDAPVDTYKLFGELVRKADCITIATEPYFVNEASDDYNYNILCFNAVSKKRRPASTLQLELI